MLYNDKFYNHKNVILSPFPNDRPTFIFKEDQNQAMNWNNSPEKARNEWNEKRKKLGNSEWEAGWKSNYFEQKKSEMTKEFLKE